MTDIEQALGDFLREEASAAPHYERPFEAVMRLARVRRFLNGAVAVAVVACIAAASVAAARSLSRGEMRPAGEPPPPTPTQVGTQHVLDDAKLIVRLPAGWDLADENLTPNLTEPGELFSAGTGPLPAGGEDCATIPEAAIEAMGPDDALVSVQEEGGDVSHGFPHRPDRFEWDDGTGVFQGCLDTAAVLRQFRLLDRGRGLYAYVAIGSDAPDERRDEALEIVSDLVVCDPGSPPGECE
jgi:hypothetical protein